MERVGASSHVRANVRQPTLGECEVIRAVAEGHMDRHGHLVHVQAVRLQRRERHVPRHVTGVRELHVAFTRTCVHTGLHQLFAKELRGLRVQRWRHHLACWRSLRHTVAGHHQPLPWTVGAAASGQRDAGKPVRQQRRAPFSCRCPRLTGAGITWHRFRADGERSQHVVQRRQRRVAGRRLPGVHLRE